MSESTLSAIAAAVAAKHPEWSDERCAEVTVKAVAPDLTLGRWTSSLHPRWPRGGSRGGQFRPTTGGGSGGHGGGHGGGGTESYGPGRHDGVAAATKKRAARLEKALAGKKPTDETHRDANGDWTPERRKQHKAIVDHLARKHRDVPAEGRAIMAGGLGGAGKSTALGKHVGIKDGDYVTINPDDIKEEMARRGMIPEVKGFSPMEASALVHEESSHIAKQLAARVQRKRQNVIWDITMSSPGSVEARLDDLERHGYSHVGAVFVHVPVETSVQRAMGRYERGVAEHRAGKGHGGRYVPPDIIRANADAEHGSRNRRTFEQFKDRFDGVRVFDSSGEMREVESERRGSVL